MGLEMELILKVISKRGRAVMLKEKKIGLETIDRIREIAGCFVPLEKIGGTIEAVEHDVCISVPEDVARESWRFKNDGERTWRCEENEMNGAIVEEIKINRDGKTNEPTYAYVVRKVDNNKALKLWAAKGYPVEEEEQ